MHQDNMMKTDTWQKGKHSTTVFDSEQMKLFVCIVACLTGSTSFYFATSISTHAQISAWDVMRCGGCVYFRPWYTRKCTWTSSALFVSVDPTKIMCSGFMCMYVCSMYVCMNISFIFRTCVCYIYVTNIYTLYILLYISSTFLFITLKTKVCNPRWRMLYSKVNSKVHEQCK